VIIIQHGVVAQDGSSAAMAAAHNAEDFRLLDVKKNRYDGTLGTVPIKFDKKQKRMIEMSPNQV